jgi:hypothetical protein
MWSWGAILQSVLSISACFLLFIAVYCTLYSRMTNTSKYCRISASWNLPGNRHKFSHTGRRNSHKFWHKSNSGQLRTLHFLIGVARKSVRCMGHGGDGRYAVMNRGVFGPRPVVYGWCMGSVPVVAAISAHNYPSLIIYRSLSTAGFINPHTSP